MTKTTLRLLVTAACPRDCEGCCNKSWDLDALPLCSDFRGYDEIILTGGEPMLAATKVLNLLHQIIRPDAPKASIYVYTADLSNPWKVLNVLTAVDGLTVTLHEQNDVRPFQEFCGLLDALGYDKPKSLRLNVFDDITLPFNPSLKRWEIKWAIQWIENCPLPENEVFMRL